MTMKKFVLSILACAAVPTLSAQTTKVEFRTLCIQLMPGLETLTIAGEKAGESTQVKLFTDVSPVVQGSFTSGQAEFFAETAGADGKPVRKAVAKGPLAKSERQLFVFIPTGSKDKLPYHLVCYDDDTKFFPMGHIRAINLAPGPVRFVISGAATPEVPPGKHALFPHSKKVNEYDMYPVVVEFKGADNAWVKGQSVNWKATDRRREIVVTMIEPKFKQPVVRIFGDVPPWLEAPAAAP
jgi:hypothetical protein